MSSSLHLGKFFFSTIELFPTIRHLHNKSNTVSTQEICQMAFCLLVHVLIHLNCKKTGRQWSSTSECHRLRSCYQCLHLGSTIDWWLVNQPGKFPPKKSHRCYLSATSSMIQKFIGNTIAWDSLDPYTLRINGLFGVLLYSRCGDIWCYHWVKKTSKRTKGHPSLDSISLYRMVWKWANGVNDKMFQNDTTSCSGFLSQGRWKLQETYGER